MYNASGLQYYRHPDWLGSSRFSSTPTRTMYNDLAFAPFGEQYAQAGSTGVTDTSFAGNNENTVANLYDAQFREYGIQGRWPSPDPAGVAAVDPSNPQSWNRYAYALNNPLALVDPSGLDCIYTHNDGSVTIVRGDCISDTDNGQFVDRTVDSFVVNADGSLDLGFTTAAGAGVFDIPNFALAYDAFAALQSLQQQNYFNNMQKFFGTQTSAQYMAAIHNDLSNIPTVCGAGASITTGNAIFGIDTRDGLYGGVIGQTGGKNVGGGFTYTASKNGLSPNAFVLVPLPQLDYAGGFSVELTPSGNVSAIGVYMGKEGKYDAEVHVDVAGAYSCGGR